MPLGEKVCLATKKVGHEKGRCCGWHFVDFVPITIKPRQASRELSTTVLISAQKTVKSTSCCSIRGKHRQRPLQHLRYASTSGSSQRRKALILKGVQKGWE